MNKKFQLVSEWRLFNECVNEEMFDKQNEQFNEFLERTFGMKYYGLTVYEIIDEAKFTMFMLKYPEHIKKISYE
jgi:hypothetical protein